MKSLKKLFPGNQRSECFVEGFFKFRDKISTCENFSNKAKRLKNDRFQFILFNNPRTLKFSY